MVVTLSILVHTVSNHLVVRQVGHFCRVHWILTVNLELTCLPRLRVVCICERMKLFLLRLGLILVLAD